MELKQQMDPGVDALAVCACGPCFGMYFWISAQLRYGVADLATLAGDTHKFESRYLEP